MYNLRSATDTETRNSNESFTISSDNQHSNSHTGNKACSQRVLKFDQFGQPLNFHFHHGSSQFRSVTGSCLSVLIFITTLVFTVSQIIVLYRYKDTIFTQSEVLDYFEEDDDFVFEEKDGLRFAVAISNTQLNPEKLAQLEQLVELKAYVLDFSGTDVQKRTVDMYKCSYEEFSTEFYPITRS